MTNILSVIGAVVGRLIENGAKDIERGMAAVELQELLDIYKNMDYLTSSSIEDRIRSVEERRAKWRKELSG